MFNVERCVLCMEMRQRRANAVVKSVNPFDTVCQFTCHSNRWTMRLQPLIQDVISF